MRRVKVTTNFPEWPLAKQTPGGKCVWGDFQFIINEDSRECDFWVVLEDLPDSQKAQCDPRNTLLVTYEPPSVKKYPSSYLKQFGAVVTCHDQLKHSQKIFSQQGLPWMIGGRFITAEKKWDRAHTKDFDELSQMRGVPKSKLLSVICSDKAFTPGHAKRLEFVKALQQRYGEEIDVFGRGIRDVEDKWDAIAPYRFHVAIENCVQPHYWTEKLSDAFLAEAHPIYYGCPNINAYFPESSLTIIDIEDPESAFRIIDDCIRSDRGSQLEMVRQAKRLTLNEYQLFPMLVSVIKDQILSQTRSRSATLHSQARCQNKPIAKLRGGVGRLLRKAESMIRANR